MKRNIQYIVENGICAGCGGCCGVCPVGAIAMTVNVAGYIVPTVDVQKCTECSLCCEVCPSVESNTPLEEEIDLFHGKSLRGYVGYASDADIRLNSQSGGIVTALLCYLLDKGKIDGAIVTNFNKETKRPQTFCAVKSEEIKKSSGSYYSQTPVVEVISKKQDKKTAAVLLGCQAESLNLIRKKVPGFRMPEYLIGLFCAGQYSGNYIDRLISEAKGINENTVGFRFREKRTGGWPGNIKIYTKDGEVSLESRVRHLLKPVYELHRCLHCFDQMNIYCDIAVGDPWGIPEKTEKEGNTVIIARTKKGEELIEQAKNEGVIVVEELDLSRIIKGQTVDCRAKTQFFTAMKISTLKNLLLPFLIENFKNISYQKPDSKKNREIKRRLSWSRGIFLEKNTVAYRKAIKTKIAMVKAKNFVIRIFSLPLRAVRFIRRIIGSIY